MNNVRQGAKRVEQAMYNKDVASWRLCSHLNYVRRISLISGGVGGIQRGAGVSPLLAAVASATTMFQNDFRANDKLQS